MLTNDDLASELKALSDQAADLAKHVRGNGDLAPRTLAGALVDVDKLAGRLAKIRTSLNGGNDRKKSR